MLKLFPEHFNTNPEFENYSGENFHSIYFPKKRNPEKAECFNFRVSSDGVQHLKLSYFIGVDWVSKHQAIYVEPKLNKDSKEQTNYLKMLLAALKHPEAVNELNDLFFIKFDEEHIEIEHKQDLLTPLITIQFLCVMKLIVSKGLKKSYYKVNQNLNSRVKGKIMVSKTIKENILKNKPLKTFCQFEEFGLNSLENRLLKKTLIFIQRYLPTMPHMKSDLKSVADILNYITPAFESVSSEVNLKEIKHSKINVFYKEYEEAIRLAKLILKRFGYNIANTNISQKIKTPPFWIDMSKLFELHVLGLLKNAFRNDIVFQFNANYGQPDFLLTGNETAIIDSKYKTRYIPERVSFDEYLIKDIRQLAGYGRDKKVLSRLGYQEKQFNAIVPKCLIIYPDQSASEDLWENPEEEIEQFSNFYKRAIKLPVI